MLLAIFTSAVANINVPPNFTCPSRGVAACLTATCPLISSASSSSPMMYDIPQFCQGKWHNIAHATHRSHRTVKRHNTAHTTLRTAGKRGRRTHAGDVFIALRMNGDRDCWGLAYMALDVHPAVQLKMSRHLVAGSSPCHNHWCSVGGLLQSIPHLRTCEELPCMLKLASVYGSFSVPLGRM